MSRIQMERSGEMEVFARIVGEGGFAAAARSLEITPSAVSKLVARLEGRLGARLFVRTTRAVTLTEEGEAYHQATLRILQDMENADQAAAGGGVRGRLRVSATIPFGTLFVAPLVQAFLGRNPDVAVELNLTDEVIDMVAARTDVAIRMGDLPDSGLVARKLGQSRRVVCAAPSYLDRRGTPLAPADLDRHDCLTFSLRRPRCLWPFRDRGRDVAQAVRGSLVVNNGETMKQMALAGAGIARLGLFHVAAEIADGRLVAVLESFNPDDVELVHAVYVGGGVLPGRVRAFIEFAAGELERVPSLR